MLFNMVIGDTFCPVAPDVVLPTSLLLDDITGVFVSDIDVDRLWWLSNHSVKLVTADQLSLALVPRIENLSQRRAAKKDRLISLGALTSGLWQPGRKCSKYPQNPR